MLPHIWKLIDSHSVKRSYMRAVRKCFSNDTISVARIEQAYNVSMKGHADQKRDTGERYFRHVLAVSVILLLHLRVRDVDLIVAALLHDLVEDKPKQWSVEKVEQEFGKRVARLVEAVTKPPKVRYVGKRERYRQVVFNRVDRAGKAAVMLKLADRLHNMLTLWGSPKKKQAKIRETIQYVLPLAVKYNVLVEELTLAIAKQIESRHINDEEVSEVGHNNGKR